jgi:hypothetical protein
MVAREKPAYDAGKYAPERRQCCHRVLPNCGHKADVNVSALPETVIVPEAGHRLRCTQCGGKPIDTRPAWHTG